MRRSGLGMTEHAPKSKTKARKIKAQQLPAVPTPLSQADAALRDSLRGRNMARPRRPEAVFERDGKNLTIKPAEGEDVRLYAASSLEALGTCSIPFFNDTIDNVMRVMSPSRNATAEQYNAGMAIMAAVEPKNELEATLASQIVAANDCAFRCMRSMAGSDHADHHKMYGELANKFLRTSAVTVEALAKLRRNGEQVVRHVHVNDGGQAVFAQTINQGGRGNNESDGQGYGTAMPSERTALSGPDTSRDGVPIPSDAERTMPHSRRAKSGCAAR